jgi:hypothetical protein
MSESSCARTLALNAMKRKMRERLKEKSARAAREVPACRFSASKKRVMLAGALLKEEATEKQYAQD